MTKRMTLIRPRRQKLQLLFCVLAYHLLAAEGYADPQWFAPYGPFRIESPAERTTETTWRDVVVNDRLLNRIRPADDIGELLTRSGDRRWTADSSLAARRATARNYDEAIYAVALDRLIQQAAALSIPEKGITEAILEGRLSPRLDDLHIAFYGIHTWTIEDCVEPNDAHWYLINRCVQKASWSRSPPAWMLEVGLITPLESRHTRGSNPDYYYYDSQGKYALDKSAINLRVVDRAIKEKLFFPNDVTLNNNERRRRWSERFGGLTDISELDTFYKGSRVVLASVDLARITAERTRDSGELKEYADPYWVANPAIYDFLWFRKLPYGLPITEEVRNPKDRDYAGYSAQRDYYRVRNERYLPMLQKAAFEILPLKLSPEQMNAQAIEVVQAILQNAGLTAPGFAVDGAWGTDDESVVAEYIKSLQSFPELGQGRAADGRWTAELSQAMRSLLSELDPEQEQVKTWQAFTDAMDHLAEVGVYQGPQQAAQFAIQPPPPGVFSAPALQPAPTQESISSGDYWRACVLSWANGFLWEFGDEIIAKLIEREDGNSARAEAFREQVPDLMERASDSNAIILMICAMFGYSVSIFGEAAIVFVGLQTERRPYKAFKLGAGVEILEEIVALLGEYSTMGSVNFQAALIMGGAAALVTGCLAAAAAGNKKRMQKEVGVSVGIVLLGCLFVWATFIINT